MEFVMLLKPATAVVMIAVIANHSVAMERAMLVKIANHAAMIADDVIFVVMVSAG